MVELQETLSFNDHILPLLLKEREKHGGKLSGDGYDAESLRKELQVRVVGQERDNAIIVTWNDASPGVPEGNEVTYLAVYVPSQHQLRLVFIHDKKVSVVGASVNKERTLLGFTITESYFGLVEDPSAPNTPVIYKSFLAEIQPQKRIYSLAIERHTFQRVQFLYGEYGSSSKKESHMLFLHHNEAIGLYHIPMARSGDKGMFINGQPRIQQVTDEFKWAQWDSQHQRLYVVYPKQKTSDETVDDDEDVNPDLMFAAYQFKERSSYVRVLYLPIPFLDVELLSKTSIPEYLDANAALTQTVSEKHINMHVVSLQGKGSFYICLQLLVTKQASETQSSSGNAAEQFSQLEYSVYVLHHGCLMNCVLPTVRPRREDLENYRIFFSSLNDYVMVFLPGHFMHLLNCNPERQPCHHIILQGDAVPKFPSSKASFCEPRLLLYLNKEISTSLQTGPYIYDCSTNAAYKYSFNKATLAELFAKTHMPSTRLAILHLAVIHLRDSGLIKKIFEHLSHDPASPECLDLLREYLVGSTYGTLRRELEKEVVTLIPFTCVDTYRGHLEKDMHRKRIAQMSCSFVKDIPIEFKNVKGKMKQVDFWTALLHNTKKLPPRFKLQTPGVDIFDYDNDSDEEMDAAPESSLVRSLYRRLSVTRRLSHHGSSESVTSQASGKSRGSVDSPAEKKSVHEAKKENAIINRLASHLQNHLPREAKVKIHNIAIEYVKCQARQSEQLIRLFNQALEFANNPFTLPLSLRGTLREVVFFQLVERFCTAVSELRFPLPPGFRSCMTCLGFRCLDRRMFLQYVDNGVLQLKKGFISRLVEEFDGEREEQDFVFQIICRLKHVEAKEAFLHWEHPFKARYLSHRLVEDLLITDNAGGTRENIDYTRESILDGRTEALSEPSPDGDVEVFRPLATLMNALRKNAVRADDKSCGVSQEDLDYIEMRALMETQRETIGSLGTIPF
ncbi:gamma-secretase-activating protein-like isoform X2 [Montipora capricornis]|uniref:gamma-secretase-activating protein-like isoform X2 n=1 Tax=Montipora capricornis TaxID=246305 RepID=UPI0035F18BD7